MSTPQHARLIQAAAKAVLRPLGCVQKGRSRIWLDDQGFWVGVIEFQPSAWSRGSYLNVGACWLWREKDHLSFDAGGYRVEGFRSYKNEEQFASAAQALAERAGEEVMKLRALFPSPSHVQAVLAKGPLRSIHDHYHLAMASGLAGDVDQSIRSFADVVAHSEDRPWAAGIKQRAAELVRCLQGGNGFQAEVMGDIRRTRALLKLPVRPEGTDTPLC